MSATLSRAWLFVPLGIFLPILLIGYYGFRLDDPHRLPSALLGKPFPEFQAPLLEPAAAAPTGGRVSRDDLLGEIVLVNVWATWCPTCKAEHDELTRIRAESGLGIVGINYKDDPDAARRWLREFGNPYDFNILDRDGSLGVELGVYGAPETFLLDAAGTIVYKRVGEITRRVWQEEMAPRIERMQGRASVSAIGGR